MLLYFILECSPLFDFSHNIILMFQEIVENQSLAHEEKNTWVNNHCVISVKKCKGVKHYFSPGNTLSLV